MNRSFIVSLIAALLLVIFSVQNAQLINIHLWFWSFDGSEALVIVISVILGFLLSYLVVYKTIRKKKNLINEKEEQIKALKEQLKKPE